MHLSIQLESTSNSFEVPVQYNYPVQAAIYRALAKDVGGFFHDVGFEHKGRRLKLFTFSRLMGKSAFIRRREVLRFEGPVTLVVSSPVPQFCSSLATGLLKLGAVTIGSAALRVTRVQISEPKVKGNSIDVKMLSPTVVYSTMTRYDGRKYTCYFAPGEAEFESLTGQNLIRKYQTLTQSDPPEAPAFSIKVKGNPKLSVLTYKGTVIKGYMCFLKLLGPRSLLQVAIDAGLGSKNSQGFGCLVPDKPVPAREVYI
ncbi:MAG TPA: CRISPR-associated endoribonuclease Cas6 [Firmicutes bacterium]|nr:CRISPR-associated endoribonuclease Cas6 [Bacillota bacterium]